MEANSYPITEGEILYPDGFNNMDPNDPSINPAGNEATNLPDWYDNPERAAELGIDPHTGQPVDPPVDDGQDWDGPGPPPWH